MRSPSISMNWPRGGSVVSTLRAVFVVNQTRPAIAATSNKTTAMMIVMGVFLIF
jgi:hypothetical protein